MASSDQPTEGFLNSNPRRTQRMQGEKLDLEECSKLAKKSLSCQLSYPNDKIEKCSEHMAAYKQCMKDQAARKAAEKAAARA